MPYVLSSLIHVCFGASYHDSKVFNASFSPVQSDEGSGQDTEYPSVRVRKWDAHDSYRLHGPREATHPQGADCWEPHS